MSKDKSTFRPRAEDPCPECGSPIVPGFGLAGGGCGFYFYCSNDSCDWFHKEQDDQAQVDLHSLVLGEAVTYCGDTDPCEEDSTPMTRATHIRQSHWRGRYASGCLASQEDIEP